MSMLEGLSPTAAMTMAMTSVHRCKCLIVGDSTVGKTSIVRVLSNPSNSFSNKYLMTYDIELTLKSLKIPNKNQIIELFLFDCSGKELYRELEEKVWSNQFHMIVGVFDVTNQQSLTSLHNWLSDVLKAIDKEKVIGIVLANKIDLSDCQVVTADDGLQLAKKFKLRLFECSAREGRGIDEAFLHLTDTWIESHNQNQLNSEL